MAHTELRLRERRTIEDMLNAKMSVREIAAEIGRHVSMVYRDIKRNGYTDEQLPELNGYYGVVAQRSATQRRARRRKLVRLIGLRKAVIKQLKEGWSPEQIAGRLQFEGHSIRVSHETLRTHGGDAHGREKGFRRIDARIARLALNSASSIAMFLIETWERKEHRALPQHSETV